ncbi:diguanylate cyclase (GGDEF) domain-containing protein [Ruminococcus sp. YE71]|uniref:diguanylate cyclase n=1 Tax=unclassified Ruminococcus TaxID=2608920 RepID=UPI00088B2F5A|nr:MULTISPECIES: GGDEF domain-containing protein [unclassified Ruminococcus]SDA11148.1 diguanylate cyclase (GGDEF) domain-containing protein [Ruminococcus sp. YE78]SFW14829.1 diguanylate cyclase (GGDEF) domain-containing protein [Ruminococcus sp. YE71]
MTNNKNPRRRPRVGLLISHLEDEFDDAVCEGAMIAAAQSDVDLVIFPGRYIDGVYADKLRTEFEYQYNTLFDLPVRNKFDVLLVLIGTIGSHLNKQRRAEFLKRYDGIPVITITSQVDGYPCISVDNKTGLVQVIEHLIDAHGCRKLGFVSGPDTSDDANERLEVFKDTLKKHGVEFLPERVVFGNFSKYVVPQVNELLDRCPDLDAIVCANDQMALAAYQVLEERGLRPGIDIAVTGFDNDTICEEMMPHLTTVKSDAAELGYNAVLEALNYINNGKLENDTIQSSMVVRNSCGCTRNARLGSLSFRDSSTGSREEFADEVCEFLMDRYRSSDETHRLKEQFRKFLFMIDDYMNKTELRSKKFREDIVSDLYTLMGDGFFKFVSIDDLFAVIEYIHGKYSSVNLDRDEQLVINRMFIQIYKVISERNAAYCKNKLEDNYFMTWLTNSITRDMLVFEAYDDEAYRSVVDKLLRVHMTSSYLFSYEPAIVNRKNDTFRLPEKLYLKSYHNLGDSVLLPPEEQAVAPEELFSNKYLPNDRRYTMIVTPLFSNEEHYGLLMCEIEHEYFNYITSVTVQLCAALRIITMMKAQARTQKMLQQSLIEIRENNQLLSDISKTDELTGCFNRRGFFEELRHKLNDEWLVGDHPYAVMIFADLDSLKIINDRFGHEEGDFAIRSAAEILKRSFKDEIVGRIGGDEFVVCTFFAKPVELPNIREHIETISARYNEEMCADKPYIIHTSVGIYPFNCTDTVEIGELLSHADSLLYEQKRKKKTIVKAEM